MRRRCSAGAPSDERIRPCTRNTPAAWALPRRLLVLVALLLVRPGARRRAGRANRARRGDGLDRRRRRQPGQGRHAEDDGDDHLRRRGADRGDAEVRDRAELGRRPAVQDDDQRRHRDRRRRGRHAAGEHGRPLHHGHRGPHERRDASSSSPTPSAGAVVTVPDGTALQWRVLQGLDLSVTSFQATVLIPGTFTYVRCTAGTPELDHALPLRRRGHRGRDDADLHRRAARRGRGRRRRHRLPGRPGDRQRADRLPLDRRAARSRPTRCRSASPSACSCSAGSALLLAHRRRGADAAYSGEAAPVGEFVPVGAGQSEFRVVGDVRPGPRRHGGRRARRPDRRDGHAGRPRRPRPPAHHRAAAGERLHPRPTGRSRASAPAPTCARSSRRCSRASRPTASRSGSPRSAAACGQSIGKVQDALYDEVVANGWYARRPDVIRNRFTQLALGLLIVAVVVTALLAAFTTFGLIGLALVVLGLGLVFVAQEMPSRTPKGVALLQGLGALRSLLLTQPTDQMPRGPGGGGAVGGAAVRDRARRDRALARRAGRHRHRRGPRLRRPELVPRAGRLAPADLPESLRNFTTTVSGTLFTR